jgi:hypothetical protein
MQSDGKSIILKYFRSAIDKIVNSRELNTDFNIPYVGGSSLDGQIVYIDEHVSRYMKTSKGDIDCYYFFKLHEIIEKICKDVFGLTYQEAHEIAKMYERESIENYGFDWNEYDKKCKEIYTIVVNKKITKIPKDLDMEPYYDCNSNLIDDMIEKMI